MDEDYQYELDEDNSSYDSTIMRSGIPKSIDKILPVDEDNADLVYRNLDMMKNYSVRKTADNDDQIQIGIHGQKLGGIHTPPLILQSTRPHKAAIVLSVAGKYAMGLVESLSSVTGRVENFLTIHCITSTHRIESLTHNWDCYTISNSCQFVKFVIQVTERSDCVMVEFKRERGCSETLGQTFDLFQKHTGAGIASNTSKIGRFRSIPMLLPEDEMNESDVPCSEQEQALTAMASWIQTNPIEALQSVGQLYGDKSRYLLKSENILTEVCNVIHKHEVDTSDVITLSLAISCLRKILSVYSEMNAPSPVTDDHLSSIRGGLIRASKGKDLTAKREASATVQTINSTVLPQKMLSL